MPPSTYVPAELLQGQMAWIQNLARHLVADESEADDLVQDTLVVALERPPADANRFRPWLARVMRNLVHQGVRGDGRRRGREERVAREESLEPTSGLVQRVTAQRALVQAVLEIDEPYRSSLLLRYFEGLPPREIARRTGSPVATVHSRLKRALAQLRETLDAAHDGDRRTWLALVVPLAEAPSTSPSAATLGAVLVNAKIVAAVLAVLVLGTVATLVAGGGAGDALASPESAAVAEPVAGSTDRAPGSGPQILGRDEEPRREPVESPRAPLTVADPVAVERTEKAPRVVRGRVLDATASPAVGIPLRYEGTEGEAIVESGPGGEFEFESDRTNGVLVAASDAWVTVRQGVDRAGAIEPVVVVAPAIQLQGTVVSDSGRRLVGAKVSVELPRGYDTRFGDVLDQTRTLNWATATGSDGEFAFERVPAIEGSRVVAVLEGYVAHAGDAPVYSEFGMTLVLGRPERLPVGSLTGRVVDPYGEPVPNARVATGLESGLTDEDGLFHIDLARAVTPDRVIAVKEGYLPATMDRPGQPAAASDDPASTGWPEFVELRLGGPPLSLSVRLVNPAGQPIEGARVWLEGTNRFGTLGIMTASIENLLDGAPVPPEAAESRMMLPAEDGDHYWDFTRHGGPSTAFWHWKTTGPDGEFEFGGLLDQTYRVRVMDATSLRTYTSPPLLPGTVRQTVELPTPELWPRVAGVVQDERGRPLAGVAVELRCDPFELSSRVFGGTATITMVVNGDTVVTDENGRFEFEDVARHDLVLTLSSDDIIPGVQGLAETNSDPTDLVLAAESRCHLSIEVAGNVEADRFRVFDEEGSRLDVHTLSVGSHNASSDGDIVDGRSGVVSVSGIARELHLFLGDVRVRTVDLDLWPGDVNLVRVD